MGKVIKLMRKIKTISVGIPAHNEELNIEMMLKQILSQEQNGFKISKIIVASDGSTDKTNQVVKELIKTNKKIVLISDLNRCGKSARINEIFRNTNSDIHINLDADIQLSNNKVFKNLVKEFDRQNVGIVGGNKLPINTKGIFNKIVNTWINLWIDIKNEYKNGNNIHNHPGCISAVSRSVYKNLEIPNNLIADEDYIFFKAVEAGYNFRFSKKAIVYYKTPSNLKDFFKQHSRFLIIKDKVSDYFGDWVNEYYIIPRSLKINKLLTNLFKNPVFLTFSIFLQIALITYKHLSRNKFNHGIWSVALSTK